MPFLTLLGLAAQAEMVPASQQGILEMVSGAGLLVQSVLYLLLLFSVVSWGIIFYKYRQVRTARTQSQKFLEIFWDSRNLASIRDASRHLKSSPLALVFRAGYEELLRVTRSKKESSSNDGLTTELGGIDNVSRAMKRAMNVELTRLEKSLTFLATTGSTTPFIGLFGTVWGIMNAFRGLSVTHSSSIQAVAPGIAEALIATAAGLVAAIPAVMAYNHFFQKIRVIGADMENFSDEFLNIAERHFLK